VGPNGYIYALDVNPFAVSHLSKKIEKCGVENAEAFHTNAAQTGLPDHHVDLAFFIGMPHVVGGIQPVLRELNRVVKPPGRISFHLGRWPEDNLVQEMAEAGFIMEQARGPIRVFRKMDAAEDVRP
jgi:ubiquinone/menaquinone biosynthesis C-methylase UbiE